VIAPHDPPDETLGEWFAELGAWDEHQAAAGPEVIHTVVSYGDHPDQVVDVWTPGERTHELLVVSIHGGFFAEDYTRDVNTPLSRALARQGFEVWNIEYRRAAPGAGGFHETTADVRAAVEEASSTSTLPLAVVGHSAGGYLAAWAAALDVVDAVVVLAGATDLEDSARGGRDEGAVSAWLGGPPETSPEAFRTTRLQRRLPTGVPHVLVHGAEDTTVPIAQSRSYAAALALAGDDVSVRTEPSTGHYALIDPRSATFSTIIRVLTDAARH
jgi:acetyl esterase/lipase